MGSLTTFKPYAYYFNGAAGKKERSLCKKQQPFSTATCAKFGFETKQTRLSYHLRLLYASYWVVSTTPSYWVVSTTPPHKLKPSARTIGTQSPLLFLS